MVKPDIKHNYYADLDLPPSATLDDVKKQYRKLALLYHPDRNAGKEDECISKFQAIQAAHEVLGDDSLRQKYDADRRKAGLYPSFNPRQPSGNPYAPYTATSAYPPPPRRTQPTAWPRPPPSGPATPGATTNGAERFSGFPRPSPTAKKDPAQDRANMFRAWQNMNSAQERQQQQPRFVPTNAQRPTGNFAPQQPQMPRTQGPPPPPRAEPKMPTEEQIRAGMKHKGPPPPPRQPAFDAESADKRQSAWWAFQQANAHKPNIARSTTMNPPPRPNAQDFSKARPGVNVQPPSFTGPSASGTVPSVPQSPVSPNSRPFADPTRPFNRRAPEQIPFTEGNRRPPQKYNNSFRGERTDLGGDGLRRSYSTRDTSKLGPQDANSRGRARSSSPHRKDQENAERDTRQKPFVVYSSSSEASRSDEDTNQTPEDNDSSTSQGQHRPATAPNATNPFDRPKKVPTPPSKRWNGSTSPPPPMPGMPNVNGHSPAERVRSAETPQKSSPNMYAKPSPSSTSGSWTSRMFGSYSTFRAGGVKFKIPLWAIPSTVNPTLRLKPRKDEFVTAADELFVSATQEEKSAYFRFQTELEKDRGPVPDNLDMEVFLKLATWAQNGISSGDSDLDRLLNRVLVDFPSVGFIPKHLANETRRASRFSFPNNHGLFDQHTKSRSEENINTKFSDGLSGQFTGEPGYFDDGARKASSPSRRGTPGQTPRSRTFDIPGPTSVPYEPVPQRPFGSAGTPNEIPRTAAVDEKFDRDAWEKKVSDPSWSAFPSGPPSPGKGEASARKQSQSRKPSRPGSRRPAGSSQQPHSAHVDDDNTVEVEGVDGQPEHGISVDYDADAMDIDNTPPTQQRDTQTDGVPTEKEARAYYVPLPAWRQQADHEQTHHHRKTSSAARRSQRASANDASKFNANLDDLRNVEPLARSAEPNGGINVADMSSSLPFQSQAATTAFEESTKPRDLPLPPLPKAPDAPQRLSKTSWHAYATMFGEYVKEFHNFNYIVLQHFASREQEVQKQISGGMGWLEASGDTSGILSESAGFGTYLRGTKEDVKVREAWNLGWERHMEALHSFEKMRERVRGRAIAGTLVDN